MPVKKSGRENSQNSEIIENYQITEISENSEKSKIREKYKFSENSKNKNENIGNKMHNLVRFDLLSIFWLYFSDILMVVCGVFMNIGNGIKCYLAQF